MEQQDLVRVLRADEMTAAVPGALLASEETDIASIAVSVLLYDLPEGRCQTTHFAICSAPGMRLLLVRWSNAVDRGKKANDTHHAFKEAHQGRRVPWGSQRLIHGRPRRRGPQQEG